MWHPTSRHCRLFCRRLSDRNLRLTDGLLKFTFDLTAGISSHRAGDVVGLSFDLFDSAGGDVFMSHDDFLWSGMHVG